jgi:Lipase
MTDITSDSVVALLQAGLNLQTFEVVGFSLGTQYSGYTARKVKAKSGITLPRIVAIDPPIWSPVKLGPSDADFVMTIHAQTWLGDPDIIGHVAFFPNGGLVQPVCSNPLLTAELIATCGHLLSQMYWIEAVATQSSTLFPARQCNNSTDFYSRACDQNSIGYMNTKTPRTLRGTYYLTTNYLSPYSKWTADPYF